MSKAQRQKDAVTALDHADLLAWRDAAAKMMWTIIQPVRMRAMRFVRFGFDGFFVVARQEYAQYKFRDEDYRYIYDTLLHQVKVLYGAAFIEEAKREQALPVPARAKGLVH